MSLIGVVFEYMHQNINYQVILFVFKCCSVFYH